MQMIRGAITVKNNSEKEIFDATEELLIEILKKNEIAKEDVFAIFFTATDDLDKAYPAKKARELGFESIPMMCFQEMKINNSLSKCIRVGLFINLNTGVKHVYLRDAVILRPDLLEGNNE
ncbi:MAG: chorismate mutase [Tissierellia bacterium]|nr:chorismate mutase [Tissierellia bacterium]